MSRQPAVLDAWAILALLQKEEPAAARVKELIQQAHANPGRPLYLSIVNLGEVYYQVGRKQGVAAAEETVGALQRLGLEVLPATNERVIAAAQIKMAHPVSYADAFAVAAARETNGILFTGDPELIALDSVMEVEILRRGA